MKYKIRIISAIMTAVLCLTVLPVRSVFAADYDAEYQINLNVKVEGAGDFNAKTIHFNYPDNRYISLRDMAVALSGTSAAYNVSITKNGITMTTGASYKPIGSENKQFDSMRKGVKDPEYIRKRNGFAINGYNTHYYTFIYPIDDNSYDCYMYLTDLALILGVDMHYENGSLVVNPNKEIDLDPRKLEESRFFYCANAALVGDATTGDVYYAFEGDASAPMASTTKLMTYLVAMDAISSGRLDLKDKVKTSAKVEKLSYSPDYSFHIKEGSEVVVEDLIYGMLLPSSNECALALAEAVAGSEENFVKKMNEKAQALGLSDGTVFFNCHGLPYFVEDVFESKIQNHITVNDMFKLVSHILAVYPDVLEVTSSTSKNLPSLGRTVYNTNSMLFNLPDAVGLKTGTTNKAGCCLVSAIEVNVNGGKHIIVAVELGAEDMVSRNSISKALLTYGRKVAKDGGISSIPEYSGGNAHGVGLEEIPDNAEDLARRIVWTARNYIDSPVPENIEIPEDTKGY